MNIIVFKCFVKTWLYASLMMLKKDLKRFHQSQIICSFKWSICFQQIICEWHIISGHHTQSSILHQIYMIQWFLFSCYKGIYKSLRVHLPPVGPYAFTPPTKILFTSRGQYEPLREALGERNSVSTKLNYEINMWKSMFHGFMPPGNVVWSTSWYK